MKLFSVYDAKAEQYSVPFSERTHESARRSFVVAVRDKETPVGRFPADYALFVVGSFDEETGVVTPAISPTLIFTGVEAARESDEKVAVLKEVAK